MNIATLYHDTSEPETNQDRINRVREWRNLLIQVKVDTDRKIEKAEEELEKLVLPMAGDSDL